MSTLSNITMRIATINDHDMVLYGFRNFFAPHEPLLNNFIEKTPTTREEEELFMGYLKENLSVIAMIGDKLVGFFLNGSYDKEASEKDNGLFGEDFKTNKQCVAIDQMIDVVKRKVDIFKKYNVEQFLYLCCIGVDPEFRGQSIGKRLFEKSFEIGKLNGFRIAVVDCSSKYSAQIAERVGMDFVASIKYSEFKNNAGIPLFQPPEEHTHLKRFVKVL